MACTLPYIPLCNSPLPFCQRRRYKVDLILPAISSFFVGPSWLVIQPIISYYGSGSRI